MSLIPARSHTFVEIDHEIFFRAILLPSQIQEGLLSIVYEVLVNCLSFPRKKVWLSELTVWT